MNTLPIPQETNPCATLEAQAQTAYNKWFLFKQTNKNALIASLVMIHKIQFCALKETTKLITCAELLELPGHTDGIDVTSWNKPCYEQSAPYVIEEGLKAWHALNNDAVCSSLTPDFQPCYESTFRDAAQRVYACRDANKVPCPNFQWDSMAASKVPSPPPV